MIFTFFILIILQNEALINSNETPRIVKATYDCRTWFYEDNPSILNHTCKIDSIEMTYVTSLSDPNKSNFLYINNDTLTIEDDYDLESLQFFYVDFENDSFLLLQALKAKYSGSLLDNYDYYLFSFDSTDFKCHSFIESNQNLDESVKILISEICK